MKKIWKKYKIQIIVFAIALVYHQILTALGNGCPIRFFTGVSCPGCGMTRAYLALFRLDIQEAFRYHPLFWTIPIVVACAFVLYSQNEKIKPYKSVVNVILILIVIAFLVTYVIRFLDPACQVVSVDMEGNQIVPRLIRWHRILNQK